MWKRTNKKIATILVIILGIFIVSCKNPLNLKQDTERAFIKISTNIPDSISRTVLPTAIDSSTNDLTWTLTGTKTENSYVIEKTWYDDEALGTAYSQMINDNSILLEEGTWTFTLFATRNNKKVLEETISSNISAGENTLSFEMKEATGNGIAGGQIDFTLKWEKLGVVEKVIPALYKYTNDEFVLEAETSYMISDIKTSDDKTNEYISFTNKPDYEFAAGYYKLELDLQQKIGTDESGSAKYETINTYTCLIHVAPGLLSKGETILSDLAQLFTISYKYVDEETEEEVLVSTFKEGYITSTYNKYTIFALPTPVRTGYEFKGWHTDSSLSEESLINNTSTYKISADTILYANWEKTTIVEEFTLYKRKADESPLTLTTGEGTTLVENAYSEIIALGTAESDNVWTYYATPKNNNKFAGRGNYQISVDVWTESDTVIGITADKTDMYFSTNANTWKNCTFETGSIQDPDNAQLFFALGRSAKTRIKNLVVTNVAENDLPHLAFNITNYGIDNYLAQQPKPSEIIEITKNQITNGFDITVNTPLSHFTGNSIVQDVTLELRDHATQTKGINKVSFDLNTQDKIFTSLCADTASPNSIVWNNSLLRVENTNQTLETCFPVYNSGEPVTISVIKSSEEEISKSSTTFSITNFSITNVENFSDKDFVIKIPNQDATIGGDLYIKSQNDTLPFSQDITLVSKQQKDFDVLMFNDFEGDSPSSEDWNNVTRFIYSNSSGMIGQTEINYLINSEYYVENKSDTEKTVRITLKADFTVDISEVTEISDTSSSDVPQNGLIYKSTENNIECLEIHSAQGLAYYRDIINGTLSETLTIKHESGDWSKTFTANSAGAYLYGYLEKDVVVENWIPIGNNSKNFIGSFDGQGHSITILSMSPDAGDYVGVFGKVGNQTTDGTVISNLTVYGPENGISTDATYAAGIVAYSDGATIENCKNNLIIRSTNSAARIGGIVGFENKTTNIVNCEDFVN
jgi:uncharacterized repeat protein (TIGR02543 family)